MEGDEKTGVTIMRVTAGLDSGPVALAEEVAVEPDDDYASLAAQARRAGRRAAGQRPRPAGRGELDFTEQDESTATYAEKVSPEERRLSPDRPAPELERAVRALSPQLGTYLELGGGERLGVRQASAVPGGPARGELQADAGELLLGSADGALRLEVVQPPGKKPMNAADFLRGHDPPAKAL